jgi:arginine decarboxylase
MRNIYIDLIKQSFAFPQEGFDLNDGYLSFHGVSLKYLIDKYKTPFRLIYLPKIGEQIQKARDYFHSSFKKYGYKGQYHYCYCTKCNHFYHIINEALNQNANLETSSSFDIDIILNLFENKRIDKNIIVVHNGYKTEEYLQKILQLQDAGFTNSILVFDSVKDLTRLHKLAKGKRKRIKIGLRMAISEEPQSAFHTSRLGIRPTEMKGFFHQYIKNNADVELKMLHFFIDSGMKDTLYYREEFQKAMRLYTQLKKECTSLDSFNLGGGFPIRNHLGFSYDYQYMTDEIVRNIKENCTKENIPEPDIFTEFGKYTVGESGAIIFKVLEEKHQSDTERWYIIDNSLMNTIPDAWSIHEKFLLLPVNKWDHEYQRVSIGGISCDHSDYYNSEDLNQEILLPKYTEGEKEPLYIGFFHTGAYQDAISGYGGLKHCLIPSPKHIIIDKDENGKLIDYEYREDQPDEEKFRILGYKRS